MKQIPLETRIAATGFPDRDARQRLFQLPVREFCDCMVRQLQLPEYADFCEQYLDRDGSQSVREAVNAARKLLWDWKYEGARVPARDRSRARFVLELLLIRPFLALDEPETMKGDDAS